MNGFGILSDFHFLRPWLLLALPLVTVLWWFWQRHSDPLKGWRDQMDEDLLIALTVGQSKTKLNGEVLILLVWWLMVLAIAGPTWRLEPSPFADDASPLMLVLKADQSMDRPNPAPARLERAKLKIADIAKTRAGQPLGLIVYAGSAHLVLPPTRDTDVVVQMVRDIETGIMPKPGDRLDEAIREAGIDMKDQGGAVLVLADSIATDAGQLRKALTAIPNTPVHVLAITPPGSPEYGTLETACQAMHATMHDLSIDDSDVDAVIRSVARSPQSKAGQSTNRWQEAGWYLVPGIVLLLAFSLRRQTSPKAEMT
ncbi:hypothetical protein FF011L_26130 [Roseimaritima multifibrata]|uniref:VWFA domain-containing protein n=1 Tax=Roseimaritima multifibrata TaxID=1930274 RepID=A0A517MG32_9BACT|nr:VWA domain-containing protein [Roseimaritima multifibrata]QDS93839.1 hypothetical protein FF011L_26130 [Roseimaritima multifibrata]